MPVTDITPAELKRRLDAGEAMQILDVREPWERAIASLPGTINIPLAELPQRLNELDRQGEVVAMCKSGGRSRRAAQFLGSAGFSTVANLAGGIDAWTRDIDPTLTPY